jgi:two-component system response regulator NreC
VVINVSTINVHPENTGIPADPDSVRVAIADDHSVVRRGLRDLLEAETGFDVVAQASELDDAPLSVSGHHPKVLILDLNMGGKSSLRLIRELRAESPGTAIVVLTTHDEPAYAREALNAGAVGYVLKDAADAELVRAVRAAAAGQRYLSPRLGARVAADSATPPGRLSRRETEALRLIALGNTNVQIARLLYLSVRTVETHRAHILRKLGLIDRAALVRYALEHRLISAGE